MHENKRWVKVIKGPFKDRFFEVLGKGILGGVVVKDKLGNKANVPAEFIEDATEAEWLTFEIANRIQSPVAEKYNELLTDMTSFLASLRILNKDWVVERKLKEKYEELIKNDLL